MAISKHYATLTSAEKMQLMSEKKKRVLLFLANEKSATINTIKLLFDYARENTVYKILMRLTEEKLIDFVYVRSAFMQRKIRFYYLTSFGKTYISQMFNVKCRYNTKNVIHAPSTLLHTLKLQELHAQLLKNNVQIKYINTKYKIMDCYFNGIAVELERTIKSKSRYKEILFDYAKLENDADYNITLDYIVYVFESEQILKYVQRVFDNIYISSVVNDIFDYETYKDKFLFMTEREFIETFCNKEN